MGFPAKKKRPSELYLLPAQTQIVRESGERILDSFILERFTNFFIFRNSGRSSVSAWQKDGTFALLLDRPL